MNNLLTNIFRAVNILNETSDLHILVHISPEDYEDLSAVPEYIIADSYLASNINQKLNHSVAFNAKQIDFWCMFDITTLIVTEDSPDYTDAVKNIIQTIYNEYKLTKDFSECRPDTPSYINNSIGINSGQILTSSSANAFNNVYANDVLVGNGVSVKDELDELRAENKTLQDRLTKMEQLINSLPI